VLSGGMHRELSRADLSVIRQHSGAGQERRGGFELLTNRFTRVGV
jgi:hypothetical protein